MAERSKDLTKRLLDDVVAEARTWETTPFTPTMKGKGLGAHCLGYISMSFATCFPELADAHEDAVGMLGPGVTPDRVVEVLGRFRKRGFVEVVPAEGQKHADLIELGDIILIKARMIQLALVVSPTEMMMATQNNGVALTEIDDRYRRRIVRILRREELCPGSSQS